MSLATGCSARVTNDGIDYEFELASRLCESLSVPSFVTRAVDPLTQGVLSRAQS